MNITVLIADDQALIRSGLRAIIESEPGIQVVGEAGDGAEAVEAVRRLRPHVALMDIRMPRLDGVAATRALLRGAAPVPTKILILTTFHLDAYVTEALRAGASGFLLKEATADQLIEAVRVIASGEAILAPSVTRRLLERMAEDPAATRDGGQQIRELLSAREADVLLLVVVPVGPGCQDGSPGTPPAGLAPALPAVCPKAWLSAETAGPAGGRTGCGRPGIRSSADLPPFRTASYPGWPRLVQPWPRSAAPSPWSFPRS